jgi:hypothetical protein
MNQYAKSPQVNINQAQKLRLKGFDAPVRIYYALPPTTQFARCVGGGHSNHNGIENRISAPSQNEAVDWLRQIHQVHCYVISVSGHWLPVVHDIGSNSNRATPNFETYASYPDALSAAIEEAFKILP